MYHLSPCYLAAPSTASAMSAARLMLCVAACFASASAASIRFYNATGCAHADAATVNLNRTVLPARSLARVCVCVCVCARAHACICLRVGLRWVIVTCWNENAWLSPSYLPLAVDTCTTTTVGGANYFFKLTCGTDNVNGTLWEYENQNCVNTPVTANFTSGVCANVTSSAATHYFVAGCSGNSAGFTGITVSALSVVAAVAVALFMA
ncbi:hypothetical protein EON67_01285 [archaeon]|nr:MAG: hypothetical protein EON67_01285 [archaeon]